MCSSPSFTILSDHTTYSWRATCSSITGNWAGAPGSARTGCSEGGNLLQQDKHEEKKLKTNGNLRSPSCQSVIIFKTTNTRRHPIYLYVLSSVQWGCSNMYSLFHPLRLVVGTKRNPPQTRQTGQTPHQRSPRMDRMGSHPVNESDPSVQFRAMTQWHTLHIHVVYKFKWIKTSVMATRRQHFTLSLSLAIMLLYPHLYSLFQMFQERNGTLSSDNSRSTFMNQISCPAWLTLIGQDFLSALRCAAVSKQ